MAMICKRWIPNLLITMMVIGILSGCVSSGQNVNTKANQPQASNQVEMGIETKDDIEEQPSCAAPSAMPVATDSTSVDDKATLPPDDNQATAKPKRTDAPKVDAQQVKPTATATPNKGTEAVHKKPVTPAKTPHPVETVTISIVADEETGTVLAPTTVEIKKDDTVIEVLKGITRKNKIQMEYRGVKGGAYVEGIDNIYEFDFGAKSGWMYRVNGEFPNKGAGSYKLKEGDVIEWIYTIDLGEDIGAKIDE